MPFSLDGFMDYYNARETSSYRVTQDTLNEVVQKVLAFKRYKTYISPDDVLNMLIDSKCLSEADLAVQIAEYKKQSKYPVIPTNHLD